MNESFNSMDTGTFDASNLYLKETTTLPTTTNNSAEYKTPTEPFNELIGQCTNLVHDLSQPLTFILTSLEIGAMEEGIEREECKLLLDAVMQMRTQIQMFRQQVHDISKD